MEPVRPPPETTVSVRSTCHRVTGGRKVVIGKPIANTSVYVLDEKREPVPTGVTGELYIGGAGVAHGYLNRPELTAERFVRDPFRAGRERRESRMYKTGDLGRWLPDGSVEYLGRNDFQVKLRGYRIELGEIEARLSTLGGVTEALVLAREDEPGDRRLVAYYTGPEAPDAEALRAHAVEGLPEYMVPSAYVRLAALPLTPNGKVDRKALPRPDGDAYVSRGYEAPQGELEEGLAAIWSEVLKVERVGRNDHFFERGGHSLLAVELIARVQRKLNSEVGLRELFVQPTLAGFAAAVSAGRSTKWPSNLVALRPEGSVAPLFAVHEAGGTVDYVRTLAQHLDPAVPVYGLEASGFMADEVALRSVPDMAVRYVVAIRRVQERGPYRLMGYSAGGNIAYAMASLLLEAGEEVAFLGLVDSYAHFGSLPDIVETMKLVDSQRDVGTEDTVVFRVLVRRFVPPGELSEFDEVAAGGDLSAMAKFLKRIGLLSADLDESALYRMVRVRTGILEALVGYRPPSLAVKATLFQAALGRVVRRQSGVGRRAGPRLA